MTTCGPQVWGHHNSLAKHAVNLAPENPQGYVMQKYYTSTKVSLQKYKAGTIQMYKFFKV